MKVGQTVRLTIVDHCQHEGLGDLITFHVFGKVLSVDGDKVRVGHWTEAHGVLDNNTVSSTIIRSTIKEVKVFR